MMKKYIYCLFYAFMGPKKGGDGGKKAEKKKQERVIEDKTFGLKNKNKSKTVQNYIKGVEHTIKNAGKSSQAIINEEFAAKAEKKKLKEEQAFLNTLNKTVKIIREQEESDDEEKKNIICPDFKDGFCEHGNNCKYSHDLNLEFNKGQADIYTDLRDAKLKLGIDYEMMEQRELKRSKMPKTEIVCKYFLDAVKTKSYGYKWNCPNGDECHYRHCLPKDYVIKTLQSKVQEDMTIDEYQDMEEKIDEERVRLARGGTKLDENTFKAWKEKKLKEKEKELQTVGGKKKNNMELLKKLKTGRQLFNDNNNVYNDDANADDDIYENQCNQLEEETKNLQDELWGKNEDNENDNDNNKLTNEINNKVEQNKDNLNVKVDENLFQDVEDDLDNIDLEDNN